MTDTENQGREVVERGTMKARDIRIGAQGINFTNAAEVMAFANMMAQSGFAVRKPFRDNPGACLAIIDDSIRFGMSPYALARGAYLVNDQLAYEAKIVAAVIIGRAAIAELPDYEFEGAGDDRICTVVIKLMGGKVIRHSSPRFGVIQPKNSPLWKSDPDQQQGYYTIRAAARRHFPHTLAGIMDLEEAAAARTIDVTPQPSGLAERLTGPSNQGFDAGKVDRAMNGEVNDGKDADKEAAGTPKADDDPKENGKAGEGAQGGDQVADAGAQPAPELTDEEKTLLADLAGELATATTEIEVAAVWNNMAGSFEHMSASATAAAALKIEAKRKKVAKPAKKK